MSAMPQHHNNEPSDDLRARVGDLALRVENGFNRVGAEMRDGFNRVDADLRDLRESMDRRFGRLENAIYYVGGGGILALIALIGTLLAGM